MIIMGPDDDLEKIREKKMREMMKKPGESKSKLDGPVDLTSAKFKEFVQSYSVVVVDCWAPWCGPCRMVAPVIEELARDYSGRVAFGKLNVDENPSVASDYQIMSIPTLLVFKNGKPVDRIVGAMPKNALEPKIARHL